MNIMTMQLFLNLSLLFQCQCLLLNTHQITLSGGEIIKSLNDFSF